MPVIGHTNYHRRGNVVSINFHLKRAEPNTRYDISLWGDFCTFFGNIGSVTTNSNGVANLSGSLTVPATSTRFFATGLSFTSFTFNDTPAVTLLP